MQASITRPQLTPTIDQDLTPSRRELGQEAVTVLLNVFPHRDFVLANLPRYFGSFSIAGPLRYHGPTQAYLARRTTEGKSKRKAIRCLKRCVAREVFGAIKAMQCRRNFLPAGAL